MKFEEYIQYDALGLAELVQTKQIPASELLEVAIHRAEAVNPKINAIITPMYDRARNKANSMPSGIFSGVPFLAKDLFQEYAGVPASCGSNAYIRQQYTPKENSEIVNRWENAGVLSFGLTNTPEFGIKGVTEPVAWGACKNPWHLKHNSGGSSGGSASAVAAGITPIAGANDGGGSIRIPASYCGLFGLKPSRGRTPWGPNRSELMHGAATQHVLTKSVRDSAAMLDVIHGFETSSLFRLPDPEQSYLELIQRPPQPLKIAYSTVSPVGTKVSKDAINAIKQTVKLLESLGHQVVEDQPNINGTQLAKDFVTTWFSQCAHNLYQTKLDLGKGIRDSDFELDTRVIAAFGANTSAVEYIHNLQNWGKYVTAMNHFFNRYDLYLMPSTATVAPKNGEVATPSWQKPILKTLLTLGKADWLAQGALMEQLIKDNLKWVPFTQLANITGLPAMSVPLYWNKHNLPLGSQFIAPFAREDRLLQLAHQLEMAQPWIPNYQNIVV